MYLFIYLAAVNLVGFAAMGRDKRRARLGRRRTPERTLFALAALGGSPGVYLGIWAFRHKTKHLSFTVGVPAITAAQLLAALTVCRLGWFSTIG